uniref:N-acetyltransferase domain-containing protein n=2 Tax=Quercus lobata TaxID=97700 RepID=A0A7N2MG27_QUELO
MEVAVVGGSTRQILGVYPGKCMELRWVSRNIRSKAKGDKEKRVSVKNKKEKVPIYVSTNPSHINSEELRDLYSACNHSCHRFPKYLGCDTDVVEAVDIHKLRTALSHSSLVVSVFCKPTDVLLFTTKSSSEINTTSNENIQIQIQGLGLGLKDLFQQLMPVTPFNAQLVGFGRAVSDFGLTASIYDVMVIPSLRGMGIGRMILKRIVRMLASRDIYDIAAVCSEKERMFFKACGFGDDILGSTTMMYSRKVSTYDEGDQLVIRAGRKLLLAPALKETSASLKVKNS